MQTAATTLEKPKAAAPAGPRKAPEIDPANVKVNSSGFVRKEVVARLPAGFVSDDLKEPGVWRKVQVSGYPLNALDAVLVVAFDRSWCAEAIVSEAMRDGVTLAGIKIISMPRRNEVLLRDDTYAVTWNGAGYHVERISDGHKMTESVGSAALAERDLRNLYAKKLS
ncbi:hypothetical protein [Bradyrhizobium sp. BR 10289]|uniref:hypothetical protein n=1 Tax=Bradyrhizobium sp. BR 10289 TaxID=2749993 RepID=UPI001C652B8D|nr:hypothetical protein [Bradyrhizobium sp. BR 10289]MBW7968608.1 hypothetical protein [Bradyrhizobium sp. BR 10289]